jgi:cellulose synthase/poly-beta-1,6-N-acetylglucosamine synthase-like glycosyltransferase
MLGFEASSSDPLYLEGDQILPDFTPKVSIIVPVYNGARVIADCLTSLEKLDYPRDCYEVIVVENCSTDNTIEIVEQFQVILTQCTDSGPATARNLGIRTSQAEIIAFTDADCVVHKDWLKELVKPFQDPRVGGVAGMIAAYPTLEASIVDRFSSQFPPLVNFQSGPGEFLPHLYTANAAYRRDALLEVGGFNPAMQTAEDVDLSWRFQLKTDHKVVPAPDAVVYHRHRSTITSLAKQYRQYGYGEILLDTMYRGFVSYPRTPCYQVGRIFRQVLALFRYTASTFTWTLRYLMKRATYYQMTLPRLWFIIEMNNVRGKFDAIFDTGLMRHASGALKKEPRRNVLRFY